MVLGSRVSERTLDQFRAVEQEQGFVKQESTIKTQTWRSHSSKP